MNIARFNFWVTRLSWSKLIGLLSGLLGVIIFVGMGLPAMHRYQAVKTEESMVQAVFTKRQQNKISVSPEAGIATFYSLLPSEKSLPDLMEKLFDAAYDNDLELEQGSFKLMREKDAIFSRYQIIIPAQGSYSDIRKFVTRVLKELPAASLDQVSFHKNDVSDEEVIAELKFTLYLSPLAHK